MNIQLPLWAQRGALVVAGVCVVLATIILPVKLFSAFSPMRWSKLPNGVYECISVEESPKVRIARIFFDGQVCKVVLDKGIPNSRFIRVGGNFGRFLESLPEGQKNLPPTTLVNR